MSAFESCLGSFIDFFDWVSYSLPPGPRFLPMNWLVNTQKFGVWVIVFCMMIYYDNWSRGAWIYLTLHGSYGLAWCIKDIVFPDSSFQTKVTLPSAS